MTNVRAHSQAWARDQIKVLDGAMPGRSKRAARLSSHPAIRLMSMLEGHGILRREGFRALMIEHLAATDADGHGYFNESRVFLDWWYGDRRIPVWAARVVADGVLALLMTERIPPVLRPTVMDVLRELVDLIAGGRESLTWLLTCVVTMEAQSRRPRM